MAALVADIASLVLPTLVRMPSSSASAGSAEDCPCCTVSGSSPVLVGLIYEIKVDDEPNPGVRSGAMASGMLFLFDDSFKGAFVECLPYEGRASVAFMDGTDATALNVSLDSFDLVVFSESGEVSKDADVERPTV